jgi:hypothetical protein
MCNGWESRRLDVCGACLTWIANGDDSSRDLLPELDAAAERAAMADSLAGWDRFARERGDDRGALIVPAGCSTGAAERGELCGCEGCEGSGFSRWRCELCEGLPGDRFPVVVQYRTGAELGGAR